MKQSLTFASNKNFLDPKLTEKGKPYGPERYKRILQECYLISKNMNTSYTDVLQTSPKEREYLINFLLEDYNQKQKAYEQEIQALEEKRQQHHKRQLR